MKKLLLMAIMVAICPFMQAQTWSGHNFEDFTVGMGVAEQHEDFIVWPFAGVTDAIVVDSVSVSGSNSFIIDSANDDIVWLLGNQDKATFEISFKIMIEPGFGGYFNLQKDTVPGTQWGGDVFFGSDSTGYLSHGGLDNDVEFDYMPGEWTQVDIVVSLQLELAFLFINREMVSMWTYSEDGTTGDPGLNVLGGVNFYAFAPAGDSPLYFVDDCSFSRVPAKSLLYAFIEPGIPGMGAVESLGAPWQLWPGGTDAVVAGDMGYGNSLNSVHLNDDVATTDIVYHLGNQNEGRVELSWQMYVDAGAGAYYNLMHDYDGGSYQWALETEYIDGTAFMTVDGEEITYDYNEDEWHSMHFIIDFDNDHAWVFANGDYVYDWQWSLQADGTDGLNQLAVLNLYPAGGDESSYYIDDISLQDLAPVPEDCSEYEDFTAFYCDEYLALNAPVWTTWGNNPGTSEDAMIVDSVYASAPNSAVFVDGNDVVYPFGLIDEGGHYGTMKMMVPTGGNGYFNLLHRFNNPTTVWAMECYFNADGTGTLNAGGNDAASFDYTFDVWHDIAIYVDLDNDYAYFELNGEMIHEWQWSLTASGGGTDSTLGAMNFYPPNGDAIFYVDDLMLCDEATGLSVEEEEASTLTLFPNPANDELNIINEMNGELNVRIFNAAGQQVMNMERVFNGGLIQISTADLNNGMYLIQLDNGTERITKRIVIQH